MIATKQQIQAVKRGNVGITPSFPSGIVMQGGSGKPNERRERFALVEPTPSCVNTGSIVSSGSVAGLPLADGNRSHSPQETKKGRDGLQSEPPLRSLRMVNPLLRPRRADPPSCGGES